MRVWRFLVLLAADRGDISIESLTLIIRTSSEEQPVGGLGVVAIAEHDSPQTINHDVVSIAILKGAQPITTAIVIGLNLATAEVSNQNSSAKVSEGGGSQGNTPRSVELTRGGEAADEVAVGIEDGDVTQPRAIILIGTTRSLSEGNEEIAQDIGNAEGGIAFKSLGVLESQITEVQGSEFVAKYSHKAYSRKR